MKAPASYILKSLTAADFPPVVPSSWLRNQKYSAEAFAAADHHALQVSKTNHASFKDLLYELVHSVHWSPMERLRVIFRWMTAKDMFGIEFSNDSLGPQEDVLLGFKKQKSTYGSIFELLCLYSDIPCLTIAGYAKGTQFRPGQKLGRRPPNHSWNVVFVEGSWQLVDCHWATRFLKSNDAANDLDNMVYEYDDFYFCTDPRQLVYSHFPLDAKWQLLNRPLTQDEFEDLPVTKSHFFLFGMSFLSHHSAVVSTAADGGGGLTMSFGNPSALVYSYQLVATREGTEADELQHGCVELTRCCMQETKPAQVNYFVLPPRRGAYYFTVYASAQAPDENVVIERLYHAVCEYKVMAEVAASGFPLLPPAADSNWGPGPVLYQSGLLPEQQDAAVKTDNKGHAEVGFQTTKPQIRVLARIRHDELTPQECDLCVKLSPPNGVADANNRIAVHLDLPRLGRYTLEVYVNNPATDGNTFVHVCQYLIVVSDDASPTPAAAPAGGSATPCFAESGQEECYDYDNQKATVPLVSPETQQLTRRLDGVRRSPPTAASTAACLSAAAAIAKSVQAPKPQLAQSEPSIAASGGAQPSTWRPATGVGAPASFAPLSSGPATAALVAEDVIVPSRPGAAVVHAAPPAISGGTIVVGSGAPVPGTYYPSSESLAPELRGTASSPYGKAPGAGTAEPGSGAPGSSVPGSGPYGSGAPGSGAPGSGPYGSGAPGSGPYGSGAPGSGPHGSGAPGSGASGSGPYGSGAPGSGPYVSGAPGSGPYVSGAPGSGAPGGRAPGSGAPGSGAPGSGAPGSGPYGSGAPGSGPYGSGAPGSASYGSGAPGSGPYGSGATGSGAPGSGPYGSGPTGSGAPGSGPYGSGAPVSGPYGSGAPGSGAPGSGPYGSGAPGSGPYGSGAPGSGPYGSGAPGSGAPGSGAPGSGAPGSGAPGSGPYGSGAPGSGPYGSGAPVGGPFGSGVPGSGAPGSGPYGSGAPGSGPYGSGAPGSGPYGSGAPGSGASGSGAPGSGAPGSGAPGSGAPGSGAPGSGAPGSGAPGSGASGSGAPGSGAPGSGQYGSGTPSSGAPSAARPVGGLGAGFGSPSTPSGAPSGAEAQATTPGGVAAKILAFNAGTVAPIEGEPTAFQVGTPSSAGGVPAQAAFDVTTKSQAPASVVEDVIAPASTRSHASAAPGSQQGGDVPATAGANAYAAPGAQKPSQSPAGAAATPQSNAGAKPKTGKSSLIGGALLANAGPAMFTAAFASAAPVEKGVASANTEESFPPPPPASQLLTFDPAPARDRSEVPVAPQDFVPVKVAESEKAEPMPIPEPLPETEADKQSFSVKRAEQFRSLDEHAVQVSSTEHNSFKDLIWDLIYSKKITDELDIARLIFLWLCTKDLSKIKFDKVNPGSPEEILQGLKDSKSTYAKIYDTLCSYAGLHSTVVTGYAKGVDYKPGMSFKGSTAFHSWNAVRIHGHYRLIDCHWASRRIVGKKGQENIRYELDDYYFLVDPRQLIYTHFPEEERWQMLKKPITLAAYEDLPPVKSLFFRYNLQLTSHDHAVIRCRDEFKLELNYQRYVGPGLDFTFSLQTEDGKEVVDGVKLSRFGLHETTHDQYALFRIRAPSKSDAYRLTIFAREARPDNAAAGKTYSAVVEYKVACDAKAAMKPFPNCLAASWGLTATAAKAAGIVPSPELLDATLNTLNGECQIAFAIARPLLFACHLKGGPKESELPGATLSRVLADGSTAAFTVSAPGRGEYGLEIFVNDPSSDGKTLRHCCQYLIVCDEKHVSGLTFPALPTAYLGPQQPSFDELGLSVSAGSGTARDPYAVVDGGSGEVELEFATSLPIRATASLSSVNDESELDDYVLQLLRDDGTLSFRCRPPAAGLYKLQVFGQPLDDVSDSLPGVYNALLRVATAPKRPPLAFPRQFSAWKEGCYLFEPVDGDLAAAFGKSRPALLPFRVRVPQAAKVAVVAGSEWTHLEQSPPGSDIFVGKAALAGSWGVEQTLALTASFGSDSSSYNTLLEYSM